jgi:Bacterial membrane protein YfhO
VRSRLATLWARLGWVPGPVWAGLVLACLELVAFWRPLTGGGVLSAATATFGFVPFRAAAPADLGSFYNPLLGDNAREYVPWLMFARDSLRSGVLPQWNPYVLAGSPFLANQQSTLFSPVNLPVWLLPFDYGIGFAAVLKLWLAGLGTFLVARQLRLGFWPSLVSAVTFGWAPFLIVWNQLPTVTDVWVAFPWAVLACERLCLYGRRGSAVGLAAALAVALTGGHPGSQIHVYTGVALYLAARLALLQGLSRRQRLRRLGMGVAAMGLGAAIAAVALLPSAMLVPGSVALSTHTGGGAVQPLSTLRTIVFPDWWGRPSGRSVPAPSNFTEATFYVGTAPLLLALIGLLGRGRWRAKAPLAAMIGLGLAVPLGVPGIHTFFADTPPWSRVLDSRMIALLDFGAALLAGFGARDLLDHNAARRAWTAAAAGVGVAVAGVVAVSPTAGTVHLVERHFLHGVSYALASVLALTSVAWWAAFAMAFAIVVAFHRRLRGPVIGVLLVALVAADLGHFLHGYQPVAPARDVYGSTPRSVAYVRRNQGSYRFTAIAGALPADMGMVWGLRDIRGYDPPLPTLRYWRFFQRGSPAAPPNGDPHFFRITAANRRVLDALSVRYILTGPAARAPSLPGFRVVYRGRDATVFENLHARPRAFVPGRNGSVAFVHDGDGTVSLVARMRRPGTVVLADQFAAGWSVSVDGHTARALRYDSVLRAVVVPAGQHRIVWRYRTPGLTAGALISLVGLTLAAVWLAVPWRLLTRLRTRIGPQLP